MTPIYREKCGCGSHRHCTDVEITGGGDQSQSGHSMGVDRRCRDGRKAGADGFPTPFLSLPPVLPTKVGLDWNKLKVKVRIRFRVRIRVGLGLGVRARG